MQLFVTHPLAAVGGFCFNVVVDEEETRSLPAALLRQSRNEEDPAAVISKELGAEGRPHNLLHRTHTSELGINASFRGRKMRVKGRSAKMKLKWMVVDDDVERRNEDDDVY